MWYFFNIYKNTYTGSFFLKITSKTDKYWGDSETTLSSKNKLPDIKTFQSIWSSIYFQYLWVSWANDNIIGFFMYKVGFITLRRAKIYRLFIKSWNTLYICLYFMRYTILWTNIEWYKLLFLIGNFLCAKLIKKKWKKLTHFYSSCLCKMFHYFWTLNWYFQQNLPLYCNHNK